MNKTRSTKAVVKAVNLVTVDEQDAFEVVLSGLSTKAVNALMAGDVVRLSYNMKTAICPRCGTTFVAEPTYHGSRLIACDKCGANFENTGG